MGRSVPRPRSRKPVVRVDAADVVPAAVALHLFAGGAGVEGIGTKPARREWLA